MIGRKLYVGIISIVAAFGGLLFGFDIAIFSGTIPFIKPYFGLNEIQLGWTGSSLYIGCIIGTFITGYLTDRFGRKYPLMVSAFIFAISCSMMGWSGSYYALVFWRILAGVGVGAASMLSPLYIAEVSPAKYRGTMVSINQLTIVIGILLAYTSNYLLADVENNWRWMFTSGSIPSLLFLVSIFFIPESPRWLILKGKDEEGTTILHKLSSKEEAEIEGSLIKSTGENEDKGKLSDLFNKNIRIIVFIGVIVAIFQQISGANAVFFYSPIIFEKAGMNVSNQLFQQILIGLTNLIFTLVAMRLVDRLGRKKLMLWGSFLMAFWLTIMGVLYHFQIFQGYWLSAIVMLFIATYASSLAPVTWVLISEIFPSRIRGKAMSLATGMLWVACFALTFVFPILFGSEKGSGLLSPLQNFFLFAGINLIYFFFLKQFIPETKGKSLEEIETLFKKKS